MEEILKGLEGYLDAFEKIRERVGDDSIAAVTLEQLGKDARAERIAAERNGNGNGNSA